MILSVECRSHGEAHMRVSAILDSYLPRVGGRAWLGAVSPEGAERLKKALQRTATRATKVVAHRMMDGEQTGIVMRVGRRDACGAAAPFPVSGRNAQANDRTPFASLLTAAVGLGALFHDLGKLSIGFADYILEAVTGAADRGRQPIRHEYVSVLILKRAIDLSGAKSDIEFLRGISRQEDALRLFNAAMDSLQPAFGLVLHNGRSSTGKSMETLLPERKTFPFMRAVTDLVMTHHRLATGNIRAASSSDAELPFRVVSYDTRHVAGPGPQKIRSRDGFLAPHPAAPDALADTVAGWTRCVASDARRVVAVLEERPSFPAREWIGATYHYGRLALMLGDHEGSKSSVARPMPLREASEVAARTCFANTKKPGSRGPRRAWDDFESSERAASLVGSREEPSGRPYLADTWPQHVHKVRRRALVALAHLLDPRDWPTVLTDELPSVLRNRAAVGSRFEWQDKAADVISRISSERPGVPWLVFLMSSTGTGKTIAIPKIGIAMSGDRGLRQNVALGLVSLTLQTGDAYFRDLGFTRDQAAVSVGSSTARLLHDLRGKKEENGEGATPTVQGVGTDAEVEDAQDVLIGGFCENAHNRLAGRVASCDNNASRRLELLLTPVLVSTVDRLMSAADARGGGHLGDALRAATADLVLDEIDSYEPEDLMALSRLVRISAVHGNSMIAASATLRLEHSATLREPFAAARREWAAIHGGSAGFNVAWISEHGIEVDYDDGAIGEAAGKAFAEKHRRAALAIAEALAVAPVRRKAIYLPPRTSAAEAFEDAYRSCLAMHEAGNHVVDRATGIRVSVGVVRWNHVRRAREFMAHVAGQQQPEGKSVLFACYHSKFPLAVKSNVAGRLSTMLSRKVGDDGSDPLLDDPVIRRHVERAALSGQRDVVAILSSTNILEAGADLDFDWGVSEPCSERSLLQLSGRIRRHRPGEHLVSNVTVLGTVIGGPGREVGRPGVETPVVTGPGSQARALIRGRRLAAEMFPSAWTDRIDGARCLVGAPSAASTAETTTLAAICLGDKDATNELRGVEDGRPPDHTFVAALSVASLASAPEFLWTDILPRLRRFRRQERLSIDIARDGDDWLLRDEVTLKAAKLNKGKKAWVDWTKFVSRDHRSLDVGSEVDDRLIFGPNAYDVQKVAEDIEARLDADGRTPWIGRELRTTSLQVPSSEGDGAKKLTYHPWLGFDRPRTGLE